MRRNTANDLRWMRRYKAIAVVGVACVVAVALELFLSYFFPVVAPWLALILTPVCVGTGYLVEHLALRLTHTQETDEIDFSYESKIRIPPRQTVIACIITSVLLILVACLMIKGYNQYLIGRYGYPMTRDSTIIASAVLGAALAAAGCIACLLRPCAFYQLVGLRTLLECVAVFTFVGGVQTLYVRGAVSLFFLLCMVAYLLSTAVIMNQMYVIQPSYFSPTCHATDGLRRAGIASVLGMLLQSLKYVWLLVAGASLLVFPWRVITFAGQRDAFSWIFVFPFRLAPVVNLIVYVFSLLTLIAFILYVCLRAKDPRIDAQLSKIKAFFRRLFLALRLLIQTVPSEWHRKKHTGDQRVEQEEVRLTYEDTVISRPRPAYPRDTVMSYGTFYRRLLALPDAKAQYCYAYRTLVVCLIAKHIGIDAHTTPQDIAEVVNRRTNIRDIDRVTTLFYASAYAPEAPAPTTNDLIALCSIVREELERERKIRK